MSEASPLVLTALAGLWLVLLFWYGYRRKHLAKSVVPEGENHPAIPRREYKRSELEHSKLTGMYKPVGADNKLVPLSAEAYHIPPDLWEV
jgi:hypothetical protein